jgi:hypothetical protein
MLPITDTEARIVLGRLFSAPVPERSHHRRLRSWWVDGAGTLAVLMF